MGTTELILGLLLMIIILVVIILLTRRWGKNFVFIVIAGFVVYLFPADIGTGIGMGLSLIIVLTYLAKKFGDFKKK